MSRGAAAAACDSATTQTLRRTTETDRAEPTGGAAAARRCAQVVSEPCDVQRTASCYGSCEESEHVVSHSVPSSISSSCIAVRRRCGARADTHGLHEEESEWSGACEYGWQIQPCRSAAHHTPGRQYARISAHRGGPRVGRLAACDTAPASGTVCCSLPPALPRLPTVSSRAHLFAELAVLRAAAAHR